MRVIRCACIIVKKDDMVLLGFNKRGFHKNKWTPIGGFLQPREPLLEGSTRLLKEQCGLSCNSFNKIGKIEIRFAGLQEVLYIHVFVTEDISGEIVETPEVSPKWFSQDAIPFNESWPDVSYWLTPAISGKKVKGTFLYQNDDLLYQDMIPV